MRGDELVDLAKVLTWLGSGWVVVPLTLLLVAFLVYGATRHWLDTLIVFSNIPVACAGGILALFINGVNFSVSAAMGFISIFGIATQVLVGAVRVPEIGGKIERTATGAHVLITMEPPAPYRVTRDGNRLTVHFDATALDASPLTGFMKKADYESVCSKMRLADGTLAGSGDFDRRSGAHVAASTSSGAAAPAMIACTISCWVVLSFS